MKRKISIIVLLCFVHIFTLCAQNISVSAPTQVSTGENFRVSYTIVNASVDDFRSASIPAGLEVIAGPYTSQQSSYQIVNGHTSRSTSITYTYTLYAEKAGTYVVGAAHAKVGNRTIASRPFRVVVSGSTRNNGSSSPNMHDDEPAQYGHSGTRIGAGDLFVKVTANKKRVCEQEPILLTYKVYTLVDLTSLDGKMPDLKGFHTQEIPLPQQKSFHIEKLNGRNYRCVTWSQYVMYPQMTGKLTIPSITFKGVVVVQNRNVDPFEAFFNGGSGYTELKRNIVAPSVDIQVDALPNKPTDFSGGVGRFSISAQFVDKTITAGVPATLRVVVGGVGNLKLIKQPVIQFPKDFDKYDPKLTDKTKLTTNGIEGNMVYDFIVVPRNKGKYTIPSVSFTYYDTSTRNYKTIKTAPIAINVAQGDGKTSSVSSYSGEKITDIKPIKQDEGVVVDVTNLFFGSMAFWMLLLVPTVVFVILVILFRRKAIANADIVGQRGKHANKVAAKRLKTAYRLLMSGKQNEFYDEVLRALWGYASDKLNISVEKLSRDNVSEKFIQYGVESDTIDKFLSALDECEYERYAPGSIEGNMTKTYDSAMIAIMEIEKTLRTYKASKAKAANAGVLKTVLFLVAFSMFTNVALAIETNGSNRSISMASANAAYSNGDYQQAATYYRIMLKKGENAKLYYNLGNSEYRLGNITNAIIAYERALRLAPGDADTRYNLQFLRSKTIDKIVPVEELFFMTWYHSVQNWFAIDTWATIAVLSLIFALVLMLCYLFGSRMLLRKVGFYSSFVLLCLFAFCSLTAFQRKQRLMEHDTAIVLTPALNVKATPDNTASDAFVIHEGTRVNITDRSMNNWFGISLDDGREGWLKKKDVEVI